MHNWNCSLSSKHIQMMYWLLIRDNFKLELDYPWPPWVKLSLNFELLVNRVMRFLLGQRLFNNNIFLYKLHSVSKKQPCYRIESNKIKDKFNSIQVTNFHNRSTEPVNYRIYARPQSIKQDDQSFISILL